MKKILLSIFLLPLGFVINTLLIWGIYGLVRKYLLTVASFYPKDGVLILPDYLVILIIFLFSINISIRLLIKDRKMWFSMIYYSAVIVVSWLLIFQLIRNYIYKEYLVWGASFETIDYAFILVTLMAISGILGVNATNNLVNSEGSKSKKLLQIMFIKFFFIAVMGIAFGLWIYGKIRITWLGALSNHPQTFEDLMMLDYLIYPSIFLTCILTMPSIIEEERQKIYASFGFHTNLLIAPTIKGSLHQYLLFFKDYVRTTKGADLDLRVIEEDNGLSLYLTTNIEKEITKERIEIWLKEYTDFIGQKVEDISFNIESSISQTEFAIFSAQIQNRLQSLENDLKLAKIQESLVKEKLLDIPNNKVVVIGEINQNINTVSNMKIDNLNIHGGNNTFADKIEKVVYSSNIPIAEQDFTTLKKGLIQLDNDSIKELKERISTIESLSEKESKDSLIEEVKEFVLKCGVAINQNIAASLIYETIKTIL